MLLSPAVLLALVATGSGADEPEPGDVGGSGLAIRCAKALICPPDADAEQFIDHALVLIRDGKIERVGRATDLDVPDGYELLDVGRNWVMPGLVELHSHEAGPSLYKLNDLNDMVYLTNPGLRVSPVPIPGIATMKRAAAGGVTTVHYIPGSGTNISGQGVLLKTGFDHYEECLLRFPGSMKLAQWGNPESWAIGVSMSFENWSTRNTLRRGVAYAKRWRDFEEGKGPEPERDIQFEIFRDLDKGKTTISTHTQLYQVVLMTLTMVRGEFDLPVFLDHSTIGGWLTGAMAEEMGVAAICGPRSADTVSRFFINWARNGHEGMRGVAAGYQERGHTLVGFNTDAPIVPLEELQLQAGMGVRYGFDDSGMQAVRGLTIVPAITIGIEDRVGSLEVGKDADILVIHGHPADPRSTVNITFIEGRRVYDAERDGRLW